MVALTFLIHINRLYSASLSNVVDIRRTTHVEASSKSAKSLAQSQTINTVTSQPSASQTKTISNTLGRLRPLVVHPTSSSSSASTFQPIGQEESGFEYSAPGQRVQIVFGSRSHNSSRRFQTPGTARTNNNETTRLARNTGNSLLNSVQSNIIPKESSENTDQAKPLNTTKVLSTVTIQSSISSTSTPITNQAVTETTTTSATTAQFIIKTTSASITTTPRKQPIPSVMRNSTMKPGFRRRKRLRRPLSRHQAAIWASSNSSSHQTKSHRHANLFSLQNRAASKHRPSVSVILASDENETRTEEQKQNKTVTNDEELLYGSNNITKTRGDSVEQGVIPSKDPPVVTSEEADIDIVDSVDVRASGKSTSDAQAFFINQPPRNNFVFPSRHDPTLSFGDRLPRPRPNSLLTNHTSGPSLLTSGTTLPSAQAMTTLTNSLDPINPLPAFQSANPSVSQNSLNVPNTPNDNVKLNQLPTVFHFNMLPVVAPFNLPFIVAPINTPFINDTQNLSIASNEFQDTPPKQTSQLSGSPLPRQQNQIQQMASITSFSTTSASSTQDKSSSSTNTIQTSSQNRNILQSQSQSSSGRSKIQEKKIFSLSSNSTFQSLDNNLALDSTGQEITHSRAKLFPSLAKPTSFQVSLPLGSGKAILSPSKPPVIRRPLTPLTRPRSVVAQTPVSDDYIRNFPEVAAPEGFPGEDPEEETIRNNIFELQRIN
ncbi:hypothetical protein SK128_025387 [Halocaridina rubra]|uniref:Uncharacterized protein n=1 Tax=Halocaridina rubra TaxID=373956 RepID=A0AAN8XIL1_HALRR